MKIDQKIRVYKVKIIVEKPNSSDQLKKIEHYKKGGYIMDIMR